MLRVSVLGTLLFALCLSVNSGCSGKPDPRESPDFNEKALSDPGSVMQNMQSTTAGKKGR